MSCQNNPIQTIKLTLICALLLGLMSACTPIISQKHPIIDLDMIMRGNDRYLAQANLDIRYYHYAINDEHFKIGIYQKAPVTQAKFLVIHDNENAAYDSAIRAIMHGGRVVVLESNERRHLYDARQHKNLDIDPNRIFQGDHPYLPLALHLLYALELQEDDVLIALHNNSPTSAFGMESIARTTNIQTLCHNDLEPKNLYWLAWAGTADRITKAQQHLCQYPVNAVVEQAPSIADGDGSLSVYTANKSMPYVNIEIKAGNKNNPDSEAHAREAQLQYIHYFLHTHIQ